MVEFEVGHLIKKPETHRLADIILTNECFEATSHIWVLPDFQHIVCWHSHCSALVVPKLLISQCVKVPIERILPLRKLNLKNIARAIGILVDVGSWMLDRFWLRLESEGRHAIGEICGHRLAGAIITLEHTIDAHQFVLIAYHEPVAIWHCDGGTLVRPSCFVEHQLDPAPFYQIHSSIDIKLDGKSPARAISILVDKGGREQGRIWHRLINDVGHFVLNVIRHGHAGIALAVERLTPAIRIHVLPQTQPVPFWHFDGGALVVPIVPKQRLKLDLEVVLPVLYLKFKIVASAVFILEDEGTWKLGKLSCVND